MVCFTSLNGIIIAVEFGQGVKINAMLFSGGWKQEFIAESGYSQAFEHILQVSNDNHFNFSNPHKHSATI